MHFGHFESTFGFIIVDFVFWTPFWLHFLPYFGPKIALIKFFFFTWIWSLGTIKCIVPHVSHIWTFGAHQWHYMYSYCTFSGILGIFGPIGNGPCENLEVGKLKVSPYQLWHIEIPFGFIIGDFVFWTTFWGYYADVSIFNCKKKRVSPGPQGEDFLYHAQNTFRVQKKQRHSSTHFFPGQNIHRPDYFRKGLFSPNAQYPENVAPRV